VSAIANRNGRSTTRRTSGSGLRTTASVRMTVAVAAAASVPFSPTSIHARCTTAPIDSRSSLMPPKSASPVNARRTPSARSVSSSRNPASTRNRGIVSSTWHSASSPSSSDSALETPVNSLSGPSGSSTAIASGPPR
jgi:hypothetical protein